jgi:predicted nucleic acid-binding protein
VNVFLDTSIVLGKLFREKNALRQWDSIDRAYGSRLMQTETRRALDRARVLGSLSEAHFDEVSGEAGILLCRVQILSLSGRVLRRA